MEKKQKIAIGLGLGLLIILLIISCFIGSKEGGITLQEDPNVILANAQKESETVKEEEKKNFIDINMDSYLEYLEKEDKNIILLARPTCSYCQIAEPILHNIAYEYDLEIHYLNTDDFNEEDKVNLMNSNEYFKEGFGTPLLLIVGNGNIIDMVDGLTDYAHYVEFLKNNNFIKVE